MVSQTMDISRAAAKIAAIAMPAVESPEPEDGPGVLLELDCAGDRVGWGSADGAGGVCETDGEAVVDLERVVPVRVGIDEDEDEDKEVSEVFVVSVKVSRLDLAVVDSGVDVVEELSDDVEDVVFVGVGVTATIEDVTVVFDVLVGSVSPSMVEVSMGTILSAEVAVEVSSGRDVNGSSRLSMPLSMGSKMNDMLYAVGPKSSCISPQISLYCSVDMLRLLYSTVK